MTGPRDMPIYLRAGQLLPARGGARLEVKCLQGKLWITQEGDPQDRIIGSGESFVLDRAGLSVVTALGDPALLVVHPGRVNARQPFRLAA